MSATTAWVSAGYAELDEVEQQKVRRLVERVAAESDPAARKAILDEALNNLRPARP